MEKLNILAHDSTLDDLSYLEEKISIFTHDGKNLNGIISIPKGSICSMVLLISGSGQVSEDGDVSSQFLGSGYQGKSAKLNYQLRNYLSRVGIVTFRYSKRDLAEQTIQNLVSDASAAMKILMLRFPNLPAHVLGFSEGAMVAVLLAERFPVQNLFLLSMLTRPIDEIFYYQFVDWPIQLLSRHRVDGVEAEFITKQNFLSKGITELPIIGMSVNQLPFDTNGRVSILRTLYPLYENFYLEVRKLLATPELKAWYESWKNIGDVRAQLGHLSSRAFIYQGSEDAQTCVTWLQEDMSLFEKSCIFRLYNGLGHCFAPMEGSIGQVKTSGPLNEDFLNQLALDMVQSTL